MDLQLILNEPNIVSTKRKRSEEDSGPNERLTAPHLLENRSRNSESICDQCSQVDWASVPTLAARGLLDSRARVLRPINESSSQLAASSCRVCRIFSRIKSPSLGRRQCMVYAISLSQQWFSSASNLPGSEKITVLSIDSKEKHISPFYQSKCLVALKGNEDKESRFVLPSSINYDDLKRLARSCEEYHGSRCTARSLYQVSGLRVIDVSSRTVVEAPEKCRYLALSYVWGRQPDPITGDALRCAPPLIEDAMSVAIALECKYLWVDRYCIPQDSPQDKHRMISQMDRVYANAFVTIIAAAGENVQIGLPGVSISPRQPQQWVDVQNTTLLELPYGEDDLLSSKWASRGWTYQEGYLSKRRIIFTPKQVLFLCNNQYMEEHVHLLLKGQALPPSILESPTRLIGKVKDIFPDFSPGSSSALRLLRQVEQYSLRELSYSSDSLNAFRGILNYCTSVPLSGAYLATHLGWGLLAENNGAGHDLRVHLDWFHLAGAKRRHEFPSWAWTGWGGPLRSGHGIRVRKKDAEHSLPHQYLTWEVSMEAEGGKTLDLYDFDVYLRFERVTNSGLHSGFVESSPRRLLITCRVLPINLRKPKLTAAQRAWWTETEFEDTGMVVQIDQPALGNNSLAVLEVWDGIYIGKRHGLDDSVNQEDVIIGLLFLPVFDSRCRPNTHIDCLLVRQVEGGFYERVGLLRDILPYKWDRTDSRNVFSGMVFLDDTGRVLDRIKLPERLIQQSESFDGLGERKTICLL